MSSRELLDRLGEAARIGALFIEGEDCINALTPESRTWTNADDINFDAAVAVPLKKTLLRIERIERFPYFAILWRRRPDDPQRVEVLLAGSKNSALGGGKGQCPPIFPALRKVFDKGKPAEMAVSRPQWESSTTFRFGHVWIVDNDSLLRSGKRVVSVFVPIRDSLEQVVAALELTCVGTDN
jgi:hypothetical protein